MISQHRFYQHGTRFGLLNPSSGVHRLEIYGKMQLHRVAILILVGYHKFTKKISSGIAIKSSSTTVLCCSWSCDLCLQFLTLANHCSSWVVFMVSIWFPASEGYQDTYFLWGQVVSLMPNPQPGGPGYPISSGTSP
jgi:hypothetical protein